MINQPKNWKKLAPAPKPGTLTVAAQPSLPKLPVPTLNDTFTKLRRSLIPIAHTKEELLAVEQKISEFENGIAPELQKRLLKRHSETDHWLEEWWDAIAYNGYRDSVVVNVSYFFGFDDHPSHLPRGPVHRAAALTRAALLFRKAYKTGVLPPEAMKEGPICMDTYRWMFDCSRVPGSGGLDWGESYAQPGDIGDSGHIIVTRKNRFWRVEISHEGKLLSTGDLEKMFKHVYDNSTGTYPGVGVLTASNRDVWAKDYEELMKDSTNRDIIRDIHSSAFIVCLDDTRPGDIDSFSRQLWHGGKSGELLQNRWVDKPCQFIVCDGEDALAGFMGEHSVMDGTPTARLCDEVLKGLASPKFDHGSPAVGVVPAPKPLDWTITKETERAIEEAIGAAKKLTDDQNLRVFETGYGKRDVKRFGFSPDSWSQLVIQLAYKRWLERVGWERPGGTYEAATTRKFDKGRTETIRSVSVESDNWVRAMDDPGADGKMRRFLFRMAAGRHIQLAKEAGNGQGVDRHLLGLKMLLKKEEGESVPRMYEDPVYVRGSRWTLSTSQLFSKHFTAYGWGEVVPDGIGVAYMAGFEERLFFNLAARKGMRLEEFREEMGRAARDMYELFKEEGEGSISGKVKAKL